VSTAHLDIWVTEVGNPCKIDMQYQWFVHVLNCDGSILEWCDQRYTNIETRCGHVDVEIPPGQYTVCATWSPAPPGERPTSLGNHISHLHIVRANCADHICVTLFPPTFHWCGVWWLRALEDHVRLETVGRERAGAAMEAVRAVLDEVPMDPFTEAMEEIARGQ
jgi:hypothetical protein